MSDAARLACLHFATKPRDIDYSTFPISSANIQSIQQQIPDAVLSSAYSAIVSYSEALSGLGNGSSSWGIIRLYYSCFYSIRTLLLASGIIPFNYKKEMMLDTSKSRYLKGGSSSHHWNWSSIKETSLSGEWYFSQDSQDAYQDLRKHRENVNYTHSFPDPDMHNCLNFKEYNLQRRFREYRDDSDFFYTYQPDHLAIAYPTRLIFEIDTTIKSRYLVLSEEKSRHVRSLWLFKDRCPVI